MDYGSLYGMGSCCGEDYTASTLLQLGEAARNNIALAVNRKPFAELTPDQQAAAAAAMQRDLQGVDLTKSEVTLPQPVVAALVSIREAIAKGLSVSNPSIGWTRPDSLDPQLALKTADFIVYSALTIVWIGVSRIAAALFLAPAISGGQEAKGQHWLVDLLFWITLFVVAGRAHRRSWSTQSMAERRHSGGAAASCAPETIRSSCSDPLPTFLLPRPQPMAKILGPIDIHFAPPPGSSLPHGGSGAGVRRRTREPEVV